MSRKYYVAYGSNLDEQRMKDRCPGAKKIGATVLEGYRITFRGNGHMYGVANIEPRKGSSVPLGIWSISQGDERNLDCYEGFPSLYYKATIGIDLPDLRRVPAIVYIMSPGRLWAKPSPDYLRTILQGYKDFGFKTRKLLYAAKTPVAGRSDYPVKEMI